MGDGRVEKHAILINGDPKDVRHANNMQWARTALERDDPEFQFHTLHPSDFSESQDSARVLFQNLVAGIQIDDDDVLVVYVTGHGAEVEIKDPESEDKTKSINVIAINGEDFISYEDFKETLSTLDYGVRFLISDGCFSGEEGTAFRDGKTHLFTGSLDGKSSCSLVAPHFWEVDETHDVDFNEDGVVTFRERYHHAYGHEPGYFKEMAPTFYSPGTADLSVAGKPARVAQFTEDTVQVSTWEAYQDELAQLKPGQHALVFFSADWCSYCKVWENKDVFPSIVSKLEGRFKPIVFKGIDGSDKVYQDEYDVGPIPALGFVNYEGDITLVSPDNRQDPMKDFPNTVVTADQFFAKHLATIQENRHDVGSVLESYRALASLANWPEDTTWTRERLSKLVLEAAKVLPFDRSIPPEEQGEYAYTAALFFEDSGYEEIKNFHNNYLKLYAASSASAVFVATMFYQHLQKMNHEGNWQQEGLNPICEDALAPGRNSEHEIVALRVLRYTETPLTIGSAEAVLAAAKRATLISEERELANQVLCNIPENHFNIIDEETKEVDERALAFQANWSLYVDNELAPQILQDLASSNPDEQTRGIQTLHDLKKFPSNKHRKAFVARLTSLDDPIGDKENPAFLAALAAVTGLGDDLRLKDDERGIAYKKAQATLYRWANNREFVPDEAARDDNQSFALWAMMIIDPDQTFHDVVEILDHSEPEEITSAAYIWVALATLGSKEFDVPEAQNLLLEFWEHPKEKYTAQQAQFYLLGSLQFCNYSPMHYHAMLTSPLTDENLSVGAQKTLTYALADQGEAIVPVLNLVLQEDDAISSPTAKKIAREALTWIEKDKETQQSKQN